ncbi:MAG: type IV pilus assembly protein PilB [Parcubacteria group bacterium Licking1014_1]|nr:MAG: type IV pilus assembly protein PilB [Parcubacteria group bacterium Licking1014_1]
MKLLQELFAAGILSEDQKNELQEEVKKSEKTEEELILGKNIVSEDFLFELKSRIFKIPLRKIKAEEIAQDILKLVSEETIVNYRMAPLQKNENVVEIGMVYPEDASAQNALRFLAGQENFDYRISLIKFSDLEKILKQYRTLNIETEKALEELSKEKGEILGVLKEKLPLKTMAEEAPIIKMVFVILRHAIESRASDIHIEPGSDSLNVRFRIDGILHRSLFLPKNVHLSVVARVKILSGLRIDENRIPQDGRFSAKINNKDVDFRVATFPTLYGEKVEIRVLNPEEWIKSFDHLGLAGKNLELVKEAIKKPYGLILFVGPTGSGKTTTQYAILRILNKESVNIVTVEDPIEYSVAGINQSQVKPEIGYTFASGLRQILRQDPNVIMVGEIRDEETAELVINAALTGHIVLSTLHANSSAGTIPRLIDMGVRPFLIPSTLRIAISQRLVRILCSHCKIKIRPSEKIRDYISEKIKSLPVSVRKNEGLKEPFNIYGAKGCESCGFSGYAGRVGLFEVLSMTGELADLILKNPLESLISKLAQKQGILTMEQEGVLKVIKGETTIEEIARATEER